MTSPRETLSSCTGKLLRDWLSLVSLRMNCGCKEEKRSASQWCEAPQEERHKASPRPTSCMFPKEESNKAWRKTASTKPCGPRCFPHDSGFVLCPSVRKASMTCDSDLESLSSWAGSSRVTSSSFLWQNPPPALTLLRLHKSSFPLGVFCGL